jgi:hypothetical protein
MFLSMCSRSSACMCSTIVYVHLLRVVVLESRSVLLLDDPKFLSMVPEPI